MEVKEWTDDGAIKMIRSFLLLFLRSILDDACMNFPHLMIPMMLLLVISACTTEEQEKRAMGDPVTPADVEHVLVHYDVDEYFSGQQKDTLLTNMVTYIYRRPADAKVETRTHPRYRDYYIRSAQEFEYVYHARTEEGVHYYYLIRPARNLERNFRGVGGRFTTNENLELVTFEEIFNTTIMDKQNLREKGLLLFEEMLTTGNVKRYQSDQNLVEWPDHRLKYNKERREWRYVD